MLADYTFIAAGSYSRAGGATNLTPGQPAGKAAGDLLVLAAGTGSTNPWLGCPTGYTELAIANSGSVRLGICGRYATNDANDNVDFDPFDGTGAHYAQLAAFRADGDAVALNEIVHGSAITGTTGGHIPIAALTITEDATLVIAFGVKNKSAAEDGTAMTDPSWMDGRIHLHVHNGNFTEIFIWGYEQQTTAANISASQWTQAIDASNSRRSLIVALSSPAVASGARRRIMMMRGY